MGINAIRETIKALAQSLQVATIFPSMLLVLVNAYVFLPVLSPNVDTTSPLILTLITAVILMLSYTFYAFNFPLIRFLEGYKLKGNPVREYLLSNKKQWYKYLMGKAATLKTQLRVLRDRLYKPVDRNNDPTWQALNYELAQLERELDRDYPSSLPAILPTALGNTIAAFEDYPRTRYGIEPIALWSRLVPLLRESKYLEFVTQEKMTFDFLLNTGIVVTLLGIEWVVRMLWSGEVGLTLIIFALTIFAAHIFYNGSIIAARQWGTTVRVAFDLYRRELHRQLGLRATENETFKDEYDRWQAVSQFLTYRPTAPNFKYFLTQYELDALEETTKDSN